MSINLTLSSRLKPLVVFAAGALLFLAPLWAKYVQTIAGHGVFSTPDAMVLLGVTMLVSLLGAYLLPNYFVKRDSPLNAFRGTAPLVFTAVFRIFATVFCLLSLVYSLYLVNQRILHAFLSSADEHSCYFLAECLRKGKLYVDIPPLADFFKVVHVGMRDGKWFSVYPPGWPLIWAAGLQFNIVDWLNPVMSTLAVFFFYLSGKRLFGRLSTVIGLAVMVLSPFFMFTAASYFSHGTCFLMVSIFLYTFFRWREACEVGKDPVGWAALCGFAVGYGLISRPLTMTVIAGPFLLYHFLPVFFSWPGWGKGLLKLPFAFKRPALRKSDWIFVAFVMFFMLLMLVQNWVVTGKLLRAPLKHYQSWERLGFKRGHYTPVDGFFFIISRIFYLMDWFAPGFVAVYLFLIGGQTPFFKKTGSDPLKTLFRFGMVFVALAYFLYYSWGGNQWGPRYWWEGMPFLCIAVADWIICRWRGGSLRVRKFLFTLVVMSLVTSGILFARHAKSTEEASRQRRALYDLAEQTVSRPAIIFIHGFLGNRLVMAEEDAVRNSPFLDTKILYAHDLGDRNKELMTAYPGREYYRGTFDQKRNLAVLERMGNR